VVGRTRPGERPCAASSRSGRRARHRGDHQRIVLNVPVRSWLEGLGAQLRTISPTPAIADAAASLPDSFPGDPADRLIYATAIERGLKLVTKDGAIGEHDEPRSLVVW
jgi:PIN domain nuclease of toxin-antitoxin system